MPVTREIRKPPKTPAAALREHRKTDRAYILYIAAGGVAIAACNAISVFGQYRFAISVMVLPMAVLFATACESVAVFLGVTSLMADRENTPSFTLRIASTVAGLAIGALNYSHDPGTALGIVTGGFSALCPHLWEILGRRLAMPELLKAGVIGQHGIRLGASRWLWHPIRSMKVMYLSTWDGTVDLATATRRLTDMQAAKAADKAARKAAGNLDRELEGIGS